MCERRAAIEGRAFDTEDAVTSQVFFSGMLPRNVFHYSHQDALVPNHLTHGVSRNGIVDSNCHISRSVRR